MKERAGLIGERARSRDTRIAKNVELLVPKYYLINDWMCSAFQSLLAHSARLQESADEISHRENVLLN